MPAPRKEKKATRRRPKGAAQTTRDRELTALANVERKKLPDKGQKFQFSTVADPLTHQDLAIIEYFTTLCDPWVADPCGVPLIMGNMCRRTVKAQIKGEIQIIANASGFAFFAMNMDGWVGNAGGGSSVYRFASYNGGTQGAPIWYTNASYVGTSFPASTATTATAGLLSYTMPLLDGQVTQYSNIRMVAAGLRAFSDAAVNTAQGKLAVIATTRPQGGAADGAIATSSYATLSGLPVDVVSFQTRPCAGWKSGEQLHAVGIPSDPNCWDFFNPPAAGQSTFSFPQLAVILSGAAANQTVTVRWVMDYEFDIGVTNLTGIESDPVVGSSASDLSGIVSTVHQLPGIKTGASSSSGGGNALITAGGPAAVVQHMALTRPLKLPALTRPSSASSMFSNLANSAMSWMVNKGPGIVKNLAKRIPYVGTVLDLLGI